MTLDEAFDKIELLSRDDKGNYNWNWWRDHRVIYHTDTGELEITEQGCEESVD